MKKVVVIGGGTGNYTVLQGLKQHDVDLTAIVSMADDGGSTGILRDELGVLPPGDVRQCLVALSNSTDLMRSLMNYRFEEGGLAGHNFGNLLLVALEKVTGSFEKAVDEMAKILFIRGRVIPVTTNEVRLRMILKDRTILMGEKEVYLSQKIDQGYCSIYLEPFPQVNPTATKAILDADLVVLGPGGLYTSLIPNLLVDGISKALRETKAKKVFVCNLMNRKGQTTGFRLSNYLEEINHFVGSDVFDNVFVNSKEPPEHLMKLYESEGELVQNDLSDKRIISANFLGEVAKKCKGDTMIRNLIRHDSESLTRELVKIVNHL